MAQATQVKIEGIKDLKMNLEELGQEVATRIGRRADREAAKLIAESIRRAVPYDATRNTGRRWKTRKGTTEVDYGHWRDNIRVRARRARKAHHIVYQVTMGRAFWSYFYEFGTKHQPARPIVRMTFDAYANDALRVQIDTLRSGIEAEAKKRERAAKRAARAALRRSASPVSLASAAGAAN